MKGYLVYVRPGFEEDAKKECLDRGSLVKIPERSIECLDASGFVLFETEESNLQKLRSELKYSELIFSRQLIWLLDKVKIPTEGDRITPLVNSVLEKIIPHTEANAFSEFYFETFDTDESKKQSALCKSLSRPLERSLNKLKLLPKGSGARHLPRLHVILNSPQEAWLGYSDVSNSSPHPMGIPRLKFPADAPSRSTLKLEEAFHTFLTPQEITETLRSGLTAVDLGACPGGWTYQLVKFGLTTTAVDNGALDPSLMKNPLVTHYRVDAFKFKPSQPVDWMVCDVVEKPSMISDLVTEWFVGGHCKRAIVNLKLPMKKRYEEIQLCLNDIKTRSQKAGVTLKIKAKQLYHDRKEITVFLEQKNS